MKKLFIANLVLVSLALILQGIFSNKISDTLFFFQLSAFIVIGISAIVAYFSERKIIGENKAMLYSFIFLIMGTIYFALLYLTLWPKIPGDNWGLYLFSAIVAYYSIVCTGGLIAIFFIFNKIQNNFEAIKAYANENKKNLGLLALLIIILTIILLIFIGFTSYIH